MFLQIVCTHLFLRPFNYSDNYLSWSLPIFSSTAASSTATVARLTMSRTGESTLMKWIGLLRPIWMGPMASARPISSIIL